jgi:hypothetical protein
MVIFAADSRFVFDILCGTILSENFSNTGRNSPPLGE